MVNLQHVDVGTGVKMRLSVERKQAINQADIEVDWIKLQDSKEKIIWRIVPTCFLYVLSNSILNKI